ncbi:HNH endonuclease [Streptomyces sp. NPDC087917]|uniref:HNH endonuclease n=1 Tax=Streptomyces sp. NPDC087917 TaxID=3155060 RepID=UPI00344501F4
MPTSPYTKQRLTAAASTSRTLTEALAKLGVDPRGPSRRYLLDRMRKLGVEVGHFEREGGKWTREILAEAVGASTTMCEVLRRLGLDVVGGNHTHISRRVKVLGVDTSHFRLPSSAGRPKVRRTPETILVKQDGAHARREQSEHLKSALASTGVPDRCRRCGTEATWQGRPLSLEVDHINGDWRDNRPENLRLLCPNCHSTTDTYRGRAKGRI